MAHGSEDHSYAPAYVVHVSAFASMMMALVADDYGDGDDAVAIAVVLLAAWTIIIIVVLVFAEEWIGLRLRLCVYFRGNQLFCSFSQYLLYRTDPCQGQEEKDECIHRRCQQVVAS